MTLEKLLRELPDDLTPADRELITKAYRVAEQAHAHQSRADGKAYITHSVEVAIILARLDAPVPVIVAGLLHDTVEDTSVTLAQLRETFGSEVSALVDGVTKLTQLPRVSAHDGRPKRERPTKSELAKETLRKTFLAMGDDVRVVVIKLADRLHNMRTLAALPPEKQQRIARETLEIFAPLANRLGIWQMKAELEDLSFRYVHPEKYKELADRVARRTERESELATIGRKVQKVLKAGGLEATVDSRPKHLYSIFRKMERKGIPFEGVFDVRGVRVLVSTETECYHALGLIHGAWKPVPGTFDDYIATPKDNFYQSLHTAVIYDDGRPLEVQIRTPEMHHNAEFGIAAHWRYKEGRKRDEAFEQRVTWLRRLMEWRQDVEDASDFVDAMKSDVFEDRAYVFTPKGDIIDLPANSTPIDFAYHVHTDIGHRCRGAKVNGKLVSLDHRLQTGDSVEILTAKRGGPSRDWLNPTLEMVRSERARGKIRQWFKRQNRQQNITQGRQLLEKELHRLGLDGLPFDQLTRELGYPSVDDMLAAIGCGDVHLGKVLAGVVQRDMEALGLPQAAAAVERRPPRDGVTVLGFSSVLTTLARCCKPVPGDPIIGYVTRGRGATIHRKDCPNALRIKDRERLVEVAWGPTTQTYPVSVRIQAYDRDGLMRDVSTLVTNEGISMSSVNVSTKNSLATFDLVMGISDLSQLSRVLNRLEALPNVLEARRLRPG